MFVGVIRSSWPHVTGDMVALQEASETVYVESARSPSHPTINTVFHYFQPDISTV